MDNPIIKAKTGQDQEIVLKAEPPENPAALFVWHLYFNRLRGAGISMTEIKNYMDLYGIELAPFQIDLIFIIHNAVEGYYHEKHKKAMDKNKNKGKR